MKIVKNLENAGYDVRTFATAREAALYLDKAIDGKSVGFGGSVTVEQLGLYDLLKTHNDIYWHARLPRGMTQEEMRIKARSTDVYICSVNAIAETGEIVNIDGTGNRVSETAYGHKDVYFVVGRNKLADTMEDAIFRARNVAAPKNAQRLNRNTPCAKFGDKCYDCNSPERICRELCVFFKAPKGASYHVILIDEELGF